MATPYAFVTLPTLPSTQDEARRRADESGDAVLVVAGRQTAGRGRTGRTWLEAPRAMYSSLAFRPGWPVEALPRLTLVAGLAVRRPLVALLRVEVGLKWPNDLIVPAGKLGGILTESQGDIVVIGCGVNLWWPDPPEGIAAASSSDPGAGLAGDLARRWVERLLDVAAGDPSAWGRDEYRSACATLGTRVEWDGGGPATAVDIDERGGLVVETKGGRLTLTSGEVRSLRPANPH